MAHVLALIPDLLFGSRVQAALTQAEHQVELTGDQRRARAATAAGEVDVLVVDLTSEDLDGARFVRELSADGVRGDLQILGFYAHVDADARARAEQAGFDLVVPRSRMAREGAQLVARLALAASD